MEDFVIWEKEYNEGMCVIQNPEGFDDQFLLMDGVELLEQWPVDVVCRMDSQYPKDIKLADNLDGGNYMVVSQRLREQIAAQAGKSKIEFLPITVLNHKGRVASRDYFVLNPVGPIECVDLEKSGVVWNAIDTTLISRVKQLVLKPGTVPKDVHMFRPGSLAKAIVVRRSLADKLLAEGFTGLAFRELTKYRG